METKYAAKHLTRHRTVPKTENNLTIMLQISAMLQLRNSIPYQSILLSF